MTNTQREIKERLLYMLQWLHDFCGIHNIRYYMVEGTMLGAVRHRGFIPWDDDIDIGMPRKDYRRFIESMTSNDTGPFMLESPGSTAEEFIYPFSKLYDSRTTLIEHNRKDIKRGLYIDIFPLDGIGNTLEESKKNFSTIGKYLDLLAMRVVALRKGRKWYKNLSVIIAQRIPNFLINEKVLIARIDNLCESRDFDTCEYVGNLVSTWRRKEIMKRSAYGEPVLYEFEGKWIYGVENPEEYLSMLYGNWRQLPPEEKRTSVHSGVYVDLTKSFLDS